MSSNRLPVGSSAGPRSASLPRVVHAQKNRLHNRRFSESYITTQTNRGSTPSSANASPKIQLTGRASQAGEEQLQPNPPNAYSSPPAGANQQSVKSSTNPSAGPFTVLHTETQQMGASNQVRHNSGAASTVAYYPQAYYWQPQSADRYPILSATYYAGYSNLQPHGQRSYSNHGRQTGMSNWPSGAGPSPSAQTLVAGPSSGARDSDFSSSSGFVAECHFRSCISPEYANDPRAGSGKYFATELLKSLNNPQGKYDDRIAVLILHNAVGIRVTPLNHPVLMAFFAAIVEAARSPTSSSCLKAKIWFHCRYEGTCRVRTFRANVIQNQTTVQITFKLGPSGLEIEGHPIALLRCFAPRVKDSQNKYTMPWDRHRFSRKSVPWIHLRTAFGEPYNSDSPFAFEFTSDWQAIGPSQGGSHA